MSSPCKSDHFIRLTSLSTHLAMSYFWTSPRSGCEILVILLRRAWIVQITTTKSKQVPIAFKALTNAVPNSYRTYLAYFSGRSFRLQVSWTNFGSVFDFISEQRRPYESYDFYKKQNDSVAFFKIPSILQDSVAFFKLPSIPQDSVVKRQVLPMFFHFFDTFLNMFSTAAAAFFTVATTYIFYMYLHAFRDIKKPSFSPHRVAKNAAIPTSWITPCPQKNITLRKKTDANEKSTSETIGHTPDAREASSLRDASVTSLSKAVSWKPTLSKKDSHVVHKTTRKPAPVVDSREKTAKTKKPTVAKKKTKAKPTKPTKTNTPCPGSLASRVAELEKAFKVSPEQQKAKAKAKRARKRKSRYEYRPYRPATGSNTHIQENIAATAANKAIEATPGVVRRVIDSEAAKRRAAFFLGLPADHKEQIIAIRDSKGKTDPVRFTRVNGDYVQPAIALPADVRPRGIYEKAGYYLRQSTEDFRIDWEKSQNFWNNQHKIKQLYKQALEQDCEETTKTIPRKKRKQSTGTFLVNGPK